MDGLTAEQLGRPIWLLADSLPRRYADALNGALDPRHPTRHSIWTPIWNEIQEVVYLPNKRRVDGNRLCIMNAVKTEVGYEPDWDFGGERMQKRMASFEKDTALFEPRLILTFGRRAFCFALLSRGFKPQHRPSAWTCSSLGKAFRDAIASFDAGKTNVVPLLHASIARGKWDEAHRGFTGHPKGNYFEFSGRQIGDLLKKYGDLLDIWV